MLRREYGTIAGMAPTHPTMGAWWTMSVMLRCCRWLVLAGHNMFVVLVVCILHFGLVGLGRWGWDLKRERGEGRGGMFFFFF